MRNYKFDAAETKEAIVKWIREYFRKNGPDCNAIVGISGGKDSTIVAALCVEALGRERVIGVLMPQEVQSDIDVAREVVEYLGIQSHEINIASAVNSLLESVRAGGVVDGSQARVNLPARIRMATLFLVSQSRNGRVANTSNFSESYLGWGTLGGDMFGQFSPLSKLTVTEVKLIGRELGLPEKFIEKAPADGLTGKTDEDNFGFTYEFLDRYIRTGEFGSEIEKAAKIDKMHDANVFKLLPMQTFLPDVYECEWLGKKNMNKTRRGQISKDMIQITESMSKLNSVLDDLNNVKNDIDNILNDEEDYRDNISENLQNSERYDKADEACDSLSGAIDSLEDLISTAEPLVAEIIGYLENAKE